MTKSQKTTIIVVSVVAALLIALIAVIIYYYAFATSPVVRKKMIVYYENDDSYTEVYAKIVDPPQASDGKGVFIGVEFVGDVDSEFTANGAEGFSMPQTDYNSLIENGVDFDNTETVYKFIASPRIWWNGGQPFAVAMYSEDGQTVYLDYDTGKADLLYYIENVMK